MSYICACMFAEFIDSHVSVMDINVKFVILNSILNHLSILTVSISFLQVSKRVYIKQYIMYLLIHSKFKNSLEY